MNEDGSQLLFGKDLLENGLLTAEQLRDALRLRATRLAAGDAAGATLETILVEKGYVTPDQFLALRQGRSNPQERRMGKYALVRELGRGGMGVVYEAVDTQLDRRVALKLMLAQGAADADDAAQEEERFVRESQLSARLKHPNIVTVYEAGVIEGRRYLAMELIEGRSLSDWWAQGGVSVRRGIEILRDVALAVHHAHEHGVLHRDLKPRNILIGPGERAYVTDFGLAKMRGESSRGDSLTQTGVVVGTPAYMSPEQAKGLESIDWRTDVYSLGVILYETLTGAPPFTGASPIEILMKVVKDPIPLPTKTAPPERAVALDRTIEAICLKALANNHRDRYVTTEAFAADLTRWLNGAPVRVTLPRARRPVGRRLLTGAAAVLLILAGAFFQRILFDAPAARPEPEPPAPSTSKAPDVPAPPAARPPDPPSPLHPADDPWADARDLLGDVDPAKDVVRGAWSSRAEGLISNDAAFARIELPFEPPEEYDLRVVFQRRTGDGGIRILLPFAGRPLACVIGGKRNTLTGFDVLNASSTSNSPLMEPRTRWLLNSRDCAVEIEVRRDRLRIQLGGDFDRMLDAKDLSAATRPAAWSLRRALTLGVGSHGSSVRFREVRLKEISGPGRAARPLEPAPLAAVTVDLAELRPELAAEYFYGTRFDSLAVRKREPRPDRDWAQGTGWTGGPADFFSCRWSGFLHVERPGRYRFEVSGDDGYRLRIDDVQVLSEWTGAPRAVSRADIRLAGGFHAFVLEHFERTNRASISLKWSTPSNPRFDPVPASAFFHVPGDRDPIAARPAPELKATIRAHDNKVTAIAFDSRGDRLASASEDNSVRIWEVRPRFVGRTLGRHANGSLAVAFNPQGRVLASGGADRSVRLWSVSDAAKGVALQGHGGFIEAVTFNADGSRLASAGEDATVRLWNARTGALLREFQKHRSGVTSVAFLSDGSSLLTGDANAALLLWDGGSGMVRRRFTGHADRIEAVAASPAAAIAATAGRDGRIMIWDVAKGERLRVLDGHRGGVLDLHFRDDGRVLVSGGADGMVRLWDPEDGRLFRTLPGHEGPVESVRFSPRGDLLASAGFDGTIRLWDLNPR